MLKQNIMQGSAVLNLTSSPFIGGKYLSLPLKQKTVTKVYQVPITQSPNNHYTTHIRLPSKMTVIVQSLFS